MKYSSTMRAKMIYVFAINDEPHKGCLKVGDTTIPDGADFGDLKPNSKTLNEAAKARISSYTKTAAVDFQLLHTESTISVQNGTWTSFNDDEVHSVLLRSGIKRKVFDFENQGDEWYVCSKDSVLAAIAAVKAGRTALDPGQVSTEIDYVTFRPEQRDAIDRTVARLSSHEKMLWNAKMRFGKTLSALEATKELAEKKGGYNRVMILTHRPVVDAGWFEDFQKIFRKDKDWAYGSKNNGRTFPDLETALAANSAFHFVWFASLQDLRGSEKVGGGFDKNDEIFSVPWDLVIVDEAHEGTQTALGKAVLDALLKKDDKGKPLSGKDATRVLALSGTPFNLLDDYTPDETYTWDYVSEQKSKIEWSRNHTGAPNPYAGLPKLNIMTFDLGSIAKEFAREEFADVEDKAFTFKEFFRTWTDDPRIDRQTLPSGARKGGFVHETDVKRFLDLLCEPSADSRYPFSTDEYRQMFRHSLWMVPGVKEAKALSSLLKDHAVFGQFGIANVAGDGDDDVADADAMKLVRKAMGSDPEDSYSITISCGRLTTGVTVPEWTAVFMLSGSVSTDAKAYMQTIFRVQSPYRSRRGFRKEECYVFDFAPDRTLKVLATVSQVAAARREGGSDGDGHQAMRDMLNFCPVIGFKGTKMTTFDAKILVEHLKRAQIDRVVRNGFEDARLYRDDMLRNLDADELAMFEDLKKIIGSTKASHKMSDLVLNDQGLNNPNNTKDRKDRTKGGRSDEDKKKKKNRDAAISIIRGISIRMPILLYGAEIIDEETELTIENFTELVDDPSWDEFMPKDKDGNTVSKEMFKRFVKYYDPDVFRAAGRQIRATARSLDKLTPLERIRQLAVVFSRFRNPDKETVLTPWKVVNRHMSDTLGGYDFYDEERKKELEIPRYVNRSGVTDRVFHDPETRILELNSKTGLYPLWCAYSVFAERCELWRKEKGDKGDPPADVQQSLWDKTLAENIFVVCRTTMAKSITLRTLRGFRTTVGCNVHAFKDILDNLRNRPDSLLRKLRNGAGYWKTNKETAMHFNAIVGNPPYQEMGGSGGSNDASIYQLFCQAATRLEPDYVSMVVPSRWFAGGRENLLGEFRRDMLGSGRVRCLHAYSSSKELFPTVEIKGGICYYLEMKDRKGPCNYYLHQDGEILPYERRYLTQFDILIRDPELAKIVEAVQSKMKELGETATVDSLLSGDTPFGIPTNPATSKKTPFATRSNPGAGFDVELDMLGEGQQRVIEYVRRCDIKKNAQDIAFDKVFIAAACGSGNDPGVLSKPIVAPKDSVCSQTFIYAKFGSAREAENFADYLKTRFFRALVSARKIDQHAPSKVYSFVPVQDFTRRWTDADLFAKYDLDDPARNWIESNIKEM